MLKLTVPQGMRRLHPCAVTGSVKGWTSRQFASPQSCIPVCAEPSGSRLSYVVVGVSNWREVKIANTVLQG